MHAGATALQQAHLQQIQAHLIRSASTSPFLSPSNSLQASQILHQTALHNATTGAGATPPTGMPPAYFPSLFTGSGGPTSEKSPSGEKVSKLSPMEQSSNVVSSTMEDEENSKDGNSSPRSTGIKVGTWKHLKFHFTLRF